MVVSPPGPSTKEPDSKGLAEALGRACDQAHAAIHLEGGLGYILVIDMRNEKLILH